MCKLIAKNSDKIQNQEQIFEIRELEKPFLQITASVRNEIKKCRVVHRRERV